MLRVLLLLYKKDSCTCKSLYFLASIQHAHMQEDYSISSFHFSMHICKITVFPCFNSACTYARIHCISLLQFSMYICKKITLYPRFISACTYARRSLYFLASIQHAHMQEDHFISLFQFSMHICKNSLYFLASIQHAHTVCKKITLFPCSIQHAHMQEVIYIHKRIATLSRDELIIAHL